MRTTSVIKKHNNNNNNAYTVRPSIDVGSSMRRIDHGLLYLQDGKLFDVVYLKGENVRY